MCKVIPGQLPKAAQPEIIGLAAGELVTALEKVGIIEVWGWKGCGPEIVGQAAGEPVAALENAMFLCTET